MSSTFIPFRSPQREYMRCNISAQSWLSVPTGAGIDFDISIIGIGLTCEQGSNLVAVGAVGKLGEAVDRVLDKVAVALALGELDQFGRLRQLALEAAGSADRFLEPPPFAHEILRRLRIVP
jgi:hypothetical protein